MNSAVIGIVKPILNGIPALRISQMATHGLGFGEAYLRTPGYRMLFVT